MCLFIAQDITKNYPLINIQNKTSYNQKLIVKYAQYLYFLFKHGMGYAF